MDKCVQNSFLASSGHFATYRTHLTKIHTQLSSEARYLHFGMNFHLRFQFVCASSEGSGESAHSAGSPETSLIAYTIGTQTSCAGLSVDVLKLHSL